MIKRILNTFMRIPGVYAVAIVGRDGLVIDGASSRNMDLEAMGALASTSIGTMEMMGRDFGQGNLDIIISEFTGGTMVMTALGRDHLLALTASPECQIGKIRYELKRYREVLRDLV